MSAARCSGGCFAAALFEEGLDEGDDGALAMGREVGGLAEPGEEACGAGARDIVAHRRDAPNACKFTASFAMPQWVPIAHGTTYSNTIGLRAGPAGTSGRATLIASSGAVPSVRDSTWVDIYATVLGRPGVAVSPHGGTITTAQDSTIFRVTNTGDYQGSYRFTPTCSWGGVALANCTASITTIGYPIPQNGFVDIVVKYTPGAPTANGRISLVAELTSSGPGNGQIDSGWVTTASVAAVAVTPKNGTLGGLVGGQPASAAFTAENTGTAGGSVTFTAVCTWGTQSLACQPSVGGADLAAGASTAVSVGFTPPADGGTSGSAMLIATLMSGGPAVADTGRYTLVRGGTVASAVTVSVQRLNPGTSIARDQCLTIAAGDAAAYECGDLRLVHALPTTTTMGQARTPTLLYNSAHAAGQALIAADVTIDNSIVPDSILVSLTINHAAYPTTRWFRWRATFAPGAPRRIVFPVDVAAVPGLEPAMAYALPYTLEVKPIVGTAEQASASDTGTVVIVDRRESPFGRGWWLDGLERLVTIPQNTTHLLWVGGDGSTRLYTRGASTAAGDTTRWLVAQAVDRPDTLLQVGTGAAPRWERRLRGGAFVEFDNAFLHVATVNRLGHRTSFRYTGSVLARVVVPPASELNVTPTFSYVFSASVAGQPFDTVTAPPVDGGARKVALGHASDGWRVTRLKDPDGTYVDVAYDGVGRATRRVNRLRDTTTYVYDPAGLLRADTVDMRRTRRGAEDAAYIVAHFCAAESASLASCTSDDHEGQAPDLRDSLPPLRDDVRTIYDGPRSNATDVADLTHFSVNRWGAPTRVVDALGYPTQIDREHLAFPALPTRVTRGGSAMTTTDDVVSETVYRPDSDLPDHTTTYDLYGNGQSNATTRFAWNARWSALDTTTTPEGVKSVREIDPTTGDVTGTYTGGANRKTTFTYHPRTDPDSAVRGLLQRVDRPAVSGAPASWEELQYDAVGNVRQITTAGGSATYLRRDAIGRVVAESLLVDSAGSAQRVTHMYDLMDRDTTTMTRGFEAQNGTVSETQRLEVRTLYDGEGRVREVRRRSMPDPKSVGELLTSTGYDAAGRVIAETAVDGHVERRYYDAAGNVLRVVTRRLAAIEMRYDALNRLLSRVTPAQTFAQEPSPFGGPASNFSKPFPRYPVNDATGVVIPRDSASFTYDALGRMETADNGVAQVSRAYYRGGALHSETQRVRTYTDSNFTRHVYTLDYTYDLDGRRTHLTFPLGATTYGYAPPPGELPTGALTSVGALSGTAPFGMAWDARDQLRSVTMPGNVVEQRAYDGDGNLARRTETRFMGTSFATDTVLHDDELGYDRRGKVVSMRGALDTVHTRYTALGMVAATYAWDLVGGGPKNSEQLVHDAMGNLASRIDGGTSHLTAEYTYETTGTGRLSTIVENGYAGSTAWHYDSAGNADGMVRADHLAGTGTPVRHYTRSYFGADEKLRVLDRRLVDYNDTAYVRFAKENGLQPSQFGSFEEYRYDALGRRVLARARRPDCGGTCGSTIQRFVWDDADLVVETRYDGREGISADSLEVEGGYVTQLSDTTGGPTPILCGGEYPPCPEPAPMYSSLYGITSYTYGLGVDHPLVLERQALGWHLQAYGTVALVPHYDWQGRADGGTRTGDGQTTKEANLPIDWPGGDVRVYGERRINGEPRSWIGEVLEGTPTSSGVEYKRNRFYDPRTGRFTQEDPIGLAGGMNLYGFAAGDPVNLSDPFGLCTSEEATRLLYSRAENGDWTETRVGPGGGFETSIFGRTSPLQQFINSVAGRVAPLESAMNAYGEVTGINGLGRSAEAFSRGDIAGGGVALALALPFGPGEVPGARILAANARTTIYAEEVFRRLAKYHGIPESLASSRLHAIKLGLGRGGADNVLFDLTGGVWDPATREWLGSLTEGGAKRLWR